MLVGLVAAAVQDDEVGNVAAKAEASSDEHDFTIYICRINQSLDGLTEEPD